jgi:alpha,alpha-trehalose-phosphate synthase [UDP-forming]/trehalose-phosphatase
VQAASDQWLDLARGPLGLLLDLDGTLIPFAATPALARPGSSLVRLVEALATIPDTAVAIVSGRPRARLDEFFAGAPQVGLVAEHGAWRRTAGVWEALPLEQGALEDLAAALERLAPAGGGAAVERKTGSLALHFRALSAADKPALVVQAGAVILPWLDRHPSFELLEGPEVLEVRDRRARKSVAVPWLRAQAAPGARLLALGDDDSDEDLFAALGPSDECVRVGAPDRRVTRARWWLPAPADAHRLLEALLELRRGDVPAPPADVWPASLPPRLAPATGGAHYDLLVVSNRLPELPATAASMEARQRNVGGLVSALEPVLAARRGLWLGWSGRTRPDADPAACALDDSARPVLAAMDFPARWQTHYYNGFCNSALWPLLHSFPGRLRLSSVGWATYVEVNESFAAVAARLVDRDATVWIHDYHLFLLGAFLRRLGHQGKLGLFLHIPFPPADVFFLLPWAEELLAGLLALDVVGFHTPDYVDNFRQCAARLPGAEVGAGGVRFRGRQTLAGAFPLGIVAGAFQEAPSAEAAAEVAGLMRALSPCRLVLGVDRLDYTKGIPERLEAFGLLLHAHPEWRRRVALVQISVPSRADLAEYAEQRERVERIVGRINGELGDADWVPIRYLYRAFARDQLAQLYRAASVGYVTPLRDGMNLVAKEFVAAQNPADPGVLLLSRFAGAAIELKEALLTNPWHGEGMAEDLHRALSMDLAERRARHTVLLGRVSHTTALTWAESFLAALASS